MADYWTTPKINWLTSDGIGYEDLNRVEANISASRDASYRKVQGFGYSISNTGGSGYDGAVTVLPGSCYSANGVPIKLAANFTKNLNTWAAGNGAAYGGMASAVTVAANTWYYVFVVSDATDGSTEIMFDDNPSGTNVSSGVYTEKRYVGSFKTKAAGGQGSFDLVEMYSTGDDTFINASDMFGTPLWYPNSVADNNSYVLETLVSSGNYALPARAVKAFINVVTEGVNFGFVNTFFTVPYPFLSGGEFRGEFKGVAYDLSTIPTQYTVDVQILVDSSRQIYIALYHPSTVITVGIYVHVRGFHDERLL